MPATPSPEDLAGKARFVFQGTVQKLKATTLSEVHDTSRTAIVRVDETIQAPKPLSHYTGREITVQLADPSEFKVGDKAVFFADAWVFGKNGVAVRSLGHHPAGPMTEALRTPGSNAVTNLEDRDTQAHYDAADLVVSGRVVNVRVPGKPPGSPRPREHDPDWGEAVVQIDQVHKGDKGKKEVVVRFPQSYDRMWAKRPKFQQGAQGHFMLHKAGAEEAPIATPAALGAVPDYYTVLHSDDFESQGHPGRIEKLLSRQR